MYNADGFPIHAIFCRLGILTSDGYAVAWQRGDVLLKNGCKGLVTKDKIQKQALQYALLNHKTI